MKHKAIEAVLQTYFDAAYESDGDKFKEVFNDVAHIYGKADGKVYDRTRDEFADFVMAGSSPNGPDWPRQDEILSIDFTSEHTAVARVKVRVKDTLYTDILSLINIDNKWTIIAKVFAGALAE
ncbi:MAG: nuclear transport factor 2 family protein [Oscillospiraceae bacterium]|nr:nuclear transport factor 2 family protein [Oscillospiraceae bacterium]